MLIQNWPQSEKWYELNERVHRRIQLPEDVSVRCYQGMPHAVFEIAQGTASFLSHRRAVGLVTGNSPFLPSLLPFLYKESFEVQLQSLFAPNFDLLGWGSQLKKETSFVVMSDFNLITGEKQDFSHLDELLNKGRIHSFRISDTLSEASIRPYTVQIVSISSQFAIALCGSKMKSPVQFSNQMIFDQDLLMKQLEMKLSEKADRAAIEKFESSLPLGFECYKFGSERIWDRSVIMNPSVNAEAVLTFIKSRLNCSSGDLVALTSCHQGPQDWAWWENQPSADLFRGALVISLELIKNPDIQKLLSESLRECQI